MGWRLASTGPRSVERGKAWMVWAHGCSRMGFNGAALSRARKVVNDVAAVMYDLQLQRGRAQSSAESLLDPERIIR